MIPKIIVLNLLRNQEKKNLIESQFIKLGLKDYLFFPAIDARNITNNIDVKIGVGYGFGRSLTKTEIAIILSHISIINYANVNNLDNIIILEDDVVLCEDFTKRVESILSRVPDVWDYIYLSGHSDYIVLPVEETEKVFKSPKMVGAFSYMVNKRAYQKIIDFCLSFMTTYDDLIMQMSTLNRLNCFSVLPFLTYIRDYYSENSQGITKNHPSIKYFRNKL